MKKTKEILFWIKGFIEATLGSARNYTAEDYKKKLKVILEVIKNGERTK